ncbi:MAG: carbohydrate kinase family protein, partial [Planctomycetes bacterium]|nr:carbohydrate kinase family protein [Planctomycetota bacterium]
AVHRLNPAVGEEIPLDELKRLVPVLRSEIGAPVFVTCGDRGVLVSDPEVNLVPSVRVSGPIDTTGAGDSASAGTVLALASGATPSESALVGNLVASITIRQLGTTGTASPDQVRAALREWSGQ